MIPKNRCSQYFDYLTQGKLPANNAEEEIGSIKEVIARLNKCIDNKASLKKEDIIVCKIYLLDLIAKKLME